MNNTPKKRTALLVIFFVVSLVGVSRIPAIATWNAQRAVFQREPERAAWWIGVAEATSSPNAELRFLSARISRKLGDVDGFRKSLAAAVELGLDEGRAERERILFQAQGGLVSSVEDRLSELLLYFDEDGREICEAFANGYIASYRINDATPLLDTWLDNFPSDPLIHVMLGRIAEHRGEWDVALQHYSDAIDVDPHFGAAFYNIGRIQLNRNQPKKALESYRKAASDLTNNTPALVGAAHCLRLLGQVDEARDELLAIDQTSQAELERAFRSVGQTSLAARTAIAGELAQIEMADANFDIAVELLQAAVDENPRDHTIRYLLGRALSAYGKPDLAEQHLKYYQQAQQEMGRLDKLMESLRMNPSDVDLRTEIGIIFIKYISPSQGIVWLNSVFTFAPNHGLAHRTLAEHYESKAESALDPEPYLAQAARHRSLAAPLRDVQSEVDDGSDER